MTAVCAAKAGINGNEGGTVKGGANEGAGATEKAGTKESGIYGHLWMNRTR